MATDFVEQVRYRQRAFVPPVQSRLDIDFYKFTMGQVIFRHFGDVEVTFKLVVRDKKIPITGVVPEAKLRMALDHAQSLKFTRTDLYYLRGMDVYGKNMFAEDYLEFLRASRMPPYRLAVVDGRYELTFKGLWKYAKDWETTGLAIISELYYQALMEKMSDHELEILYARAKAKLYAKLETIKKHPHIRFSDFGQRRRHSFLWQEWVIGLCKEMMGEQFVGTSNTWMAFKYDLIPIGTNAHELPMVMTALADSKEGRLYAQYRVLELWQEIYGQGLRVFLPDTYGTKQFLDNAPAWVATWRGMRQDSGDPIVALEQYCDWLQKHGVDPLERLGIPSDGLNVAMEGEGMENDMIRLSKNFIGRLPLSFGWGTFATNDFYGCHTDDENFRPFSMVCKVVEANGRPCVKLSDNPGKETGPREAVEVYRRDFGTARQASRTVLV